MRRVADWIDQRSGYRDLLDRALGEKVGGGASFAYVFGSVLAFTLLLQMTTGVFLALYYSPSASDAWASVAYLQDQATMGWFVRGLHSYGASAMVIVAGLHLVQTAIYGAYKQPRELNWILGVVMLGLLLAAALTGYLLPWDQTGYWATKVATGIAGTSPLVGDQVRELVQGGNEYGNLTLTRFYALHVLILPALLIGLSVVHVALFRRHGVTPHWRHDDEALAARAQPFWPDQLFRDLIAMAALFAVLIAVNLSTHGADLGAPADPATQFDARPEWYFRFLFQALKYFEGPAEIVVSLGAPILLGGALLAMPLLDRRPQRSPARRLPVLLGFAVGLVAIAALTAISFREDAADADLQERLAEADERAQLARSLAREYGVPPAGGPAVFTIEPGYRGRMLWRQECESCHDGPEREAPEIVAGYNSRDWIRAFLLDPKSPRFFGLTDINEMKPVKLEGADLDAVVELVFAQTGADGVDAALVARGAAIFDDECTDCHEIDWETEGEEGPNLGRRGSVDMLYEFISKPDHERWFGEDNAMPEFGGELPRKDVRALAEYVASLRDLPYQPGPEMPAGWRGRDAGVIDGDAGAVDAGPDGDGGAGAADAD